MLQCLRRAPVAFKLALIYILWVSMLPAFSVPPTWWNTPPTKIWETDPSTNEHHAPINIGQLKHVADRARVHLDLAVEANLPDFTTGSGAEVAALVDGFSSTDNNHALANIGQLKAVGKVFYDRLFELGYDTRSSLAASGVNNVSLGLWSAEAPYYPWDPGAPAEENHAPANVGQLKLVFSFDLSSWDKDADTDGDGLTNGEEVLVGSHAGIADEDGDGILDGRYKLDSDSDGIPDWWEVQHFGSIDVATATTDTDGDGLNDIDEYLQHINPHNSDTDGDGIGDETDLEPNEILSGWWQFDEDYGQVARDRSNFKRAAIISGGAWSPEDGVSGGSLSLVSNDHVSLPFDALDGSLSSTISLWFKTTSTGVSTLLTSETSDGVADLSLQVNSNGTVDFKPGGGVTTTVTGQVPGVLNNSQWHHLTVVRDGAAPAVRIYVDGKEVASNTSTGIVTQLDIAEGELILGSSFVGSIDELVIYRYALSSAQIQAIWDELNNREDDLDLFVHYAFEETTGTNIVDSVAPSEDGVFVGLAGDPARVSSPAFGGGILFEGEEETINIPPTAIEGKKNLTIELWLNFNDVESDEFPILHAVDAAGSIEMATGIKSHNQFYFRYYNNTTSEELTWDHASLADGHGHSIVLVRDQDQDGTTPQVTLYIDGETQGTKTATGLSEPALEGVSPLIGTPLARIGFVELFDYRLYERALNGEEVAFRMNADENGNGLPDSWENNQPNLPKLPDGITIDPDGLHPEYKIPVADVQAMGLEASGELLTAGTLMDAYKERFDAIESRKAAIVNLDPDATPGSPNSIVWEFSEPSNLFEWLLTLNRISDGIDAIKGEYLNHDRLEEGAGLGSFEHYDDISLPPIGRVTRENYPTKIGQIGATLGKLKALKWPVKAKIALYSDADEFHVNPDDPNDINLLMRFDYRPAVSDNDNQDYYLKDTKLFSASTYASGSFSASHSYSHRWADESFGPMDKVTSITTFSPTFDGELILSEDIAWNSTVAEGLTLTDFGLSPKVREFTTVENDEVTPVSLDNLQSAVTTPRSFKVTIGHRTSGTADQEFYQYQSPEGYDEKIADNNNLLPYLYGIVYIDPSDDTEKIDWSLLSPSQEIFLQSVFVPQFTPLPELRGPRIPSSVGSEIPLGDFACDTGLSKLVVPLGPGLGGGNQEAALTILTRLPWEGRDHELPNGVAHPNERFPLGLGHPSALTFAGSKADFDIVYEDDFTAIEDLTFPSYITDLLDVGNEEYITTLAEVQRRIEIWSRPRIKQVMGSRLFVNIDLDPDEDGEPNTHSYAIDLYWASDVGTKIGSAYPIPAVDPIRRILVKDSTDFQAAGPRVIDEVENSTDIKLEISTDIDPISEEAGRKYELTGRRKTSAGDKQEWILKHDYDPDQAGWESSITATYDFQYGARTANLTVTETLDSANPVDYVIEYANVNESFDQYAVATRVQNGNPTDKYRTVTYDWADTANSFAFGSTRDLFRLEKVTYGEALAADQDKSWTLFGREEIYDGASGWGSLSEITHTIDGQDLVTTIIGDGSTIVRLSGVQISNTDTTLSNDLAVRTMNPGTISGLVTELQYHTAGPYAWTPYTVVYPDNTIDKSLHRFEYGVTTSTTTTGIKALGDKSYLSKSRSTFDEDGFVIISETEVDDVTTASTRVTARHASGAPETITTLGTELEEVRSYNHRGWLLSVDPPGERKIEYTGYDTLGRVSSIEWTEMNGGAIQHFERSYKYASGGNQPGLEIVTKNGTIEVAETKETHDFHGGLKAGAEAIYGLKSRPTKVTVSAVPDGSTTFTQTTQEGNYQTVETYSVDGFLKSVSGSAMLAPVNYSIGTVSAGGTHAGKLFHEESISSLGNFERTIIDSAGNVVALQRPSAAYPTEVATWNYIYNFPGNPPPPNGEHVVTVTEIDPDIVVTRTITDGRRLGSIGLTGFDPISIEYSATGETLGMELKRGSETLGTSSYDPAKLLLKSRHRGLASRETSTWSTLAKDGSTVNMKTPRGLDGQVQFEGGLYHGGHVDGPRGRIDNTVEYHSDLSLKESSGRAAGRGYGTQISNPAADGTDIKTHIDVTNGNRSYDLDHFEKPGGGSEIEIEDVTSGGSWNIIDDVIDEGGERQAIAAANGTGMIAFEQWTGIDDTNEEIQSYLLTGGAGVPTEFRAKPTGHLKTKTLPEDATSTPATVTLTVNHTATGRIAGYVDARGNTFTVKRQQGLITEVNLQKPGDAPGVTYPEIDVRYGRTVGEIQVGHIEDITGRRHIHRDAYGQTVALRYEDFEDVDSEFDGIQIWSEIDLDGNPINLTVSHAPGQDFSTGPAPGTVLSHIDYGYRSYNVLHSAGVIKIPTADLETVSFETLPGAAETEYQATYDYSPPADGDPTRLDVGKLEHRYSGRTIARVEMPYYAFDDPGEGAYSGALEAYRTTSFAWSGNAGWSLGFAVSYDGHGNRDQIDLNSIGDQFSLYSEGDSWTFSYATGPAPEEYRGMLLGADFDGVAYSFNYNPLGVRVTAGTTTYTPNAVGNRLDAIGGITLPYDPTGNRLSDTVGQLSFTWDAKNRLSQVDRADGSRLATYQYDSEGRRYRKTLYESNGVTVTASHYYLYHGWDLVMERIKDRAGSLLREKHYVWGLDIDGTLDGAGGVGGLLLISDRDIVSGETTNSVPIYDGHGNIVALADADTGAVVAEYAYGAYGEDRGNSGVRSAENPFRYSTKYFDAETGLYYYGYRYYEPDTGTWLSRDPLGEAGGLNLYGFVENDPINGIDYLGMATILTGNGNPIVTSIDRLTVEWPTPESILPDVDVADPPPVALMQPLLDELNKLISDEIGWHFVDQFDATDVNIRATRTPEENDRFFNARTDWSLVGAEDFEMLFNRAFAKSAVPDSYRDQIFVRLTSANAERRASAPRTLAERSHGTYVIASAILTLGRTTEFTAALAIPGPTGEARITHRMLSGGRFAPKSTPTLYWHGSKSGVARRNADGIFVDGPGNGGLFWMTSKQINELGVGAWKIGGNTNVQLLPPRLINKGGIEATYTLTKAESAAFRRAWGFDFNWNPYQWWKGAAGQYYHRAGTATWGQRLGELGKAGGITGAGVGGAWGLNELFGDQ